MSSDLERNEDIINRSFLQDELGDEGLHLSSQALDLLIHQRGLKKSPGLYATSDLTDS